MSWHIVSFWGLKQQLLNFWLKNTIKNVESNGQEYAGFYSM